MDRFFGYARILTTGAPLPTASITVFDAGTANLAVIYDDDLATPTPKANSFVADGNGFFFFYAAVGKYDVKIEGGATAHAPYTWGDVSVGEVHDKSHVLVTPATVGDHSAVGLTVGHVLTALTATTFDFQSLPSGLTLDHGELVGLGDDDHAQYPLLVGRRLGQDLAGGEAAFEDLTLRGTSHANVGDIFLNPDGGNVGIGRSPVSPVVLDVQGLIQSRSQGFRFPDGTTQITAAGSGTPSTWTIIGDNIRSANIGNVGIGIDNPGRKLHVGTNVPGPLQLVQTNPVLECSIELIVDGIRKGLVSGGPNGLRLTSGPGPSTNHFGLFATPDGKIGINTLTPLQSGLHVYGPQTDDPIRVQSDVGFKPGVALYEDTTFRGALRATPQRIGLFGQFASAPGVAGLSVDHGTHRVGIGLGEETPQATLHIRGGAGTAGRDSVHLRVEGHPFFPPIVELWDANPVRRGLMVATDTFFRIAPGNDVGGLLFDPSNGFVAIGPTVPVPTLVVGTGDLPARRLSVFSRSGEALQLHLETETGGASGIDLFEGGIRRSRYRATSSVVEIEDQSGVVLTIDQSNSRVGIGVATPTEVLDVSGSVHAAAFPVSSDERFKKDVTALGACLSKVRSLRGVTYRWNDFYRHELGRGSPEDGTQVGFIAQEVEPIFPELVRAWSDEKDHYLGIDYMRMVPILVEAIKELADRLDGAESSL